MAVSQEPVAPGRDSTVMLLWVVVAFPIIGNCVSVKRVPLSAQIPSSSHMQISSS